LIREGVQRAFAVAIDQEEPAAISGERDPIAPRAYRLLLGPHRSSVAAHHETPVGAGVDHAEGPASVRRGERARGHDRRGRRRAPLKAPAPQELHPVRARVVLAERAKVEVLLDGPEEAVMVVALLLAARGDHVAEQHRVDLVRTIVDAGALRL